MVGRSLSGCRVVFAQFVAEPVAARADQGTKPDTPYRARPTVSLRLGRSGRVNQSSTSGTTTRYSGGLSRPANPQSQIATALRTLLVSGYIVTNVDRISQRAALLSVHRRDRLGGIAASTILLAGAPSNNICEMLRRTAEQTRSQPLAVTDAKVANLPAMKPEKFFELLGGEIRSDRLVREDLPAILCQLGHNKLPAGFSGTPENLLEDYVKEGLEFILESRGWRYGQDRLFESVPDGLVLGKLNLYFDGKAYEKGYHPSADDIKRFAGYVNDFNERYAAAVGRIHSFLVVSGSFTAKKEALEKKATDFYARCGTQLCHVEAEEFGQIVTDVRLKCFNRSAIKWVNVFSRLRIDRSSITSELRRIAKDKIVID